jgi:hypothetical protein
MKRSDIGGEMDMYSFAIGVFVSYDGFEEVEPAERK